MDISKRIIFGFLAAFLFQCFFIFSANIASGQSEGAAASVCRPGRFVAFGGNGEQDSSVEWFKDHLGISPKYQEKRLGIAGVSWLQFFTIIFLASFSVGSLAAYYSWKRKTRRILLSLLEEDKHAREKG